MNFRWTEAIKWIDFANGGDLKRFVKDAYASNSGGNLTDPAKIVAENPNLFTHESSHAKVWEDVGIQVVYLKSLNGAYGVAPDLTSLNIWLDKNKWDRIKFIELLKKVISAPGEDMSPSDECQVKILEGKIMNNNQFTAFRLSCSLIPD